MAGIPPQLLNRLRQALLECEQFESDRKLRSVFNSYEPLRPWRSSVPQADSLTSRVDNVIGFLVDKRRSDTKENALVLFVRLLSEFLYEADERYQQLADLADELERAIVTSSTTKNFQRNFNNPEINIRVNKDFQQQERHLPCAVILTAIPVEYMAVRAHVIELQEEIHPQGTIYERGKFADNGQVWEVGIVEIGAGNTGAALEAERAIAYFKPDVVLFVGVAGGIKDVALGDVVAATKVYGYESGKAKLEFLPRPDVGLSTYNLIQRAKAEARKTDWLKRLTSTPTNPAPHVFVAPIAAGEKVVASTQSRVFKFLQSNYNDALVVEMEGRGLLQATHANAQVAALIIRGISDLINGKSEADADSWQKIAARHASAFAFEILAKLNIYGQNNASIMIRGSIEKSKVSDESITSIGKSELEIKEILFLAANPVSTNRLRLDEEIREIKAGLRRSKNREQFVINQKWAVRARDLRRAILEFNPQIIHFSGHGAQSGEVTLEDETGEVKPVNTEDFAKLFEFFKEKVNCVLLSHCYSEVQAEAIAQHINYVIGITNELSDSATIQFTIAFYDALGAGRSIEQAYNFGCATIALAGIPDSLTPILRKQPNLELQQYERQLQQYEREFSKAITQEYPLSDETRASLRVLPLSSGIKYEDFIPIEIRLEDIEVIRRFANNKAVQNTQRLAEAITRRIGATDVNQITFSQFPEDSLWEIVLPETGLQLQTQKVIFYIALTNNSIDYKQLTQICNENNAQFVIIVTITDVCNIPGYACSQIILLRLTYLKELISCPNEKLTAWLARFLIGHISINVLPGLLPYNTKGPTKYFYGREEELTGLIYANQRGGIILGANRSGKTSLLKQLSKRLRDLGNKVIGPLTILELSSFFTKTCAELGYDHSPVMTLEGWSSIIKNYRSKNQKKRLVFLLDEVDQILEANIKETKKLGWYMRSLQNEGYCEFYLAGHAKLREAIALEAEPFRNFAEEITLTGLSETAGMDLIQKPMSFLGFKVSEEQARRIFQGTDGVAVLIQEFCIRLVKIIRQSNLSLVEDTNIEKVEDTDIKKVEELPDFLEVVFEHYEYAKTPDTMLVTLSIAILEEAQRIDITQFLQHKSVIFTRDCLDKALKFLDKFGVIKQEKAGIYKVSSSYLLKAIKARDPNSLLSDTIAKFNEKKV
ncbi:MAG: 5'-methylthioadenosine/S-adenosylhomocysteine nucleosidase [Nostoc sp.]|uniref:5'-methylthioadenosine/S-adenosylhomocysteine nucleosidase n=1 Tax=Nostoc sp. TaxID=1180 RepID=UPI002FF6B22B